MLRAPGAPPECDPENEDCGPPPRNETEPCDPNMDPNCPKACDPNDWNCNFMN